jgi:hypothetical protein
VSVADKLGDWLLKKGRIAREQLERALRDQAFFRERLGNTLVKLGFIDEDVLGEYLADTTHAPYAPARLLEKIPPEVIATVPARVAAKYCIIPIAIEKRKLHLAMRDPKDLLALDEIAFLTGMPVEPFVAAEFRIIKAIEIYYQISIGTKAIPVAEGPGDANTPRPTATKAPPAPPPSPAPRNPGIGLDGLPLDADPDDLDQPFVSGPGLAPPAILEGSGPIPASLEDWRAEAEDPKSAGATPPHGPGPSEPAAPRATPPARVTQPLPASTGSPGAPAAAALVPAVVAAPAPAPNSMEAIAARLRQADTRDDVFGAVLDFTTAQFRRAALFVVQQHNILGWSGRGAGLSPLRIRNVVVPLDRPSLFVFFRSGANYYYGPVPDLPANAKFYLDLGCPPPARVLLLPLVIKDKPSVILYADNGPDAALVPNIQVYRRLLHKAALALEVLILRNKIMMV